MVTCKNRKTSLGRNDFMPQAGIEPTSPGFMSNCDTTTSLRELNSAGCIAISMRQDIHMWMTQFHFSLMLNNSQGKLRRSEMDAMF